MFHLSSSQYRDKVFEYLEHIGYPQYIMEFEPEDVAYSISNTIDIFYKDKASYRLCAICIFALTLKYQVMRVNRILN
jgi:hypothetical protein